MRNRVSAVEFEYKSASVQSRIPFSHSFFNFYPLKTRGSKTVDRLSKAFPWNPFALCGRVLLGGKIAGSMEKLLCDIAEQIATHFVISQHVLILKNKASLTHLSKFRCQDKFRWTR